MEAKEERREDDDEGGITVTRADVLCLGPPPWGHPSVGVTMHLEPSRFGWC